MTAPIVWGLLPKAQDDATTIDAAITAAIAAHNDDPDAHMAAGQSIDVHRTNDVIDHPAGSVVADKPARQRTLATNFDTLDALSVYGSAYPYFGVVRIPTTAVNGNVSQLAGYPNWWSPIDWTKEMYLRIAAKVSTTSAIVALIGAGCDDMGDGLAGFGFRITNGTLEAYHAEDTGSGAVFTTQTITGITLTDWNVYEVFYDPVFGTLTFKINGVQVAQFTSGLPTTNDDGAMMLQVKTTAAAVKTLYASDFVFQTTY